MAPTVCRTVCAPGPSHRRSPASGARFHQRPFRAARPASKSGSADLAFRRIRTGSGCQCRMQAPGIAAFQRCHQVESRVCRAGPRSGARRSASGGEKQHQVRPRRDQPVGPVREAGGFPRTLATMQPDSRPGRRWGHAAPAARSSGRKSSFPRPRPPPQQPGRKGDAIPGKPAIEPKSRSHVEMVPALARHVITCSISALSALRHPSRPLQRIAASLRASPSRGSQQFAEHDGARW